MSSMSQTMYWVCSDVLSLILQLRNSRDLPAPDILQRRVLGLFETMMQNGREQRIPEQDMIDAKFALAAFADEIIYHSTWPGKTQWLSNPLQLQFFGINTSGDGFFVNLGDNLHVQRGRNHVAQIYFLCLALGFQGKYRLRNQEGLQQVVEGLGNYVAVQEGGGDVLAPNAERKDAGAGVVRRELPFVGIATGIEGPRGITGGAEAVLAQGPKVVFVTEGAAGAHAFTAARSVFVPARRVEVVDTVGAGDTFNAGVLAALHGAGALTRAAVAALSEDALRGALTLAVRAAAVTVSRAGANPPWAKELC